MLALSLSFHLSQHIVPISSQLACHTYIPFISHCRRLSLPSGGHIASRMCLLTRSLAPLLITNKGHTFSNAPRDVVRFRSACLPQTFLLSYKELQGMNLTRITIGTRWKTIPYQVRATLLDKVFSAVR